MLAGREVTPSTAWNVCNLLMIHARGADGQTDAHHSDKMNDIAESNKGREMCAGWLTITVNSVRACLLMMSYIYSNNTKVSPNTKKIERKLFHYTDSKSFELHLRKIELPSVGQQAILL